MRRSSYRFSPVTRGTTTLNAEQSSIVTSRESDSPWRLWKRTNAVAQRGQQLNNHASQLQMFNGQRRDTSGWVRMFPFRLYQVPVFLKQAYSIDVSFPSDWRTYRVRAGRVRETNATGTDGFNQDPDSSFIPGKVAGVETAIICVADTPAFYFWLEIGTSGGSTTAVIRYGDDPTVDTYDDTINPSWTTLAPWTDFPSLDGQHVLIAKVDTDTNSATSICGVRQYLRADIVDIGGGTDCPQG